MASPLLRTCTESDDLRSSKMSAMDRFREVRATSVALATPLSPEDCQVQSMPDASPVKWHLAHTTWFFETFMLSAFVPGYTAYSPAYRVLFNSYYNAVGEKHPRAARGMLSRPPLSDVMAYRAHVDAAMLALCGSRHQDQEAVDALLQIGINHEQQHQELILTDLKHMLSCNPLKPAYQSLAEPSGSIRSPAGASSTCGAAALLKADAVAQAVGTSTPAHWTDFPGGLISIGHAAANPAATERAMNVAAQSDASATGVAPDILPSFTFDNESPRHQVFLQPYRLANRVVTQGEYLAFMQDGGYERPALWLSAGWDAVCSKGWHAPMYWERMDGNWHQFTLHGMQPLDLAAPVTHVSYFEADAYARWAGSRLPREAEWEHAAAQTGAPSATRDNLLEAGHLAPVAAGQHEGLTQMFGDVWEWTASSYDPYPGFRTPEGAVGEYNGKFMCNQYVLRGGSCVTPVSHIRATYRNFFPTDARWQFSGIRLARDV